MPNKRKKSRILGIQPRSGGQYALQRSSDLQ
jgi:hypothetical protein